MMIINIQISAKDGLGIENLLHSISKKIKPEPITALIRININQSKERASNIFSVQCYSGKY